MVRKLLLLLALLTLPGVAHADWQRAESKHFVVYSNGKPADLKAYAAELERFDKAMRVLRDLPDPPLAPVLRVTVYVVADMREMERLSGLGIGGFYMARQSGAVAFVPQRAGAQSGIVYRGFEPQVILFHEYAHHFMFSMAPNAAYPKWFTEGFAEFHSTARIDPDGAVTFGAPPRSTEQLLDGNPIRMERMLMADTLRLSDTEFGGLYARGWLLLHYLTFGGKREGQLAAYLAAINSGKGPAEAGAVFGDLDTLDRELGRYKLGALRTVTLNPAALTIGPVTVTALTPGEDATMSVRLRSEAGVNRETAPGVYEDAKRLCGRFPNDPGAQTVLAEAAFDAKDYAGAEAAADRAIAADPARYGAWLYKARARMAVAVAAKDTSRETWNAIRKLIGVANRGDPDNPEPLILYYWSYTDIGQAPTPTARQGLYRAFMLAPQIASVRLLAARSYLAEGQPQMARMILQPLAFAPHNGKLAQEATALIAEIDRGDTKRAVSEPRTS